MEGEQPDYLSYLLRLWRVGDDEEPMWRASLKSAHTGQQVGFGNLEELFEFLRWRAGTPSRSTSPHPLGQGDRTVIQV